MDWFVFAFGFVSGLLVGVVGFLVLVVRTAGHH